MIYIKLEHLQLNFAHKQKHLVCKKIDVATLALGLRPRQGLARLWGKREARGSHLMLPGMQKSVK